LIVPVGKAGSSGHGAEKVWAVRNRAPGDRVVVKGLVQNAEKALGRAGMPGLIEVRATASTGRGGKMAWAREDTRVSVRVEGKGWRLAGGKR
jgi:hypothetical protein